MNGTAVGDIFLFYFSFYSVNVRDKNYVLYTSNLLMFKVSPNWYCVMYLTKYRIYSYSIYNIQYSRIHICVLYSKEEKGGTGRVFFIFKVWQTLIMTKHLHQVYFFGLKKNNVLSKYDFLSCMRCCLKKQFYTVPQLLNQNNWIF